MDDEADSRSPRGVVRKQEAHREHELGDRLLCANAKSSMTPPSEQDSLLSCFKVT